MLKITFKFVGGPHDGKTLEGSLGDGSDAERYYLFTNHSRVGQRFKVASDYAVDTLAEERLQGGEPHKFQRHYYVVVDRIENDDLVLVRAEYVPQETNDEEATT